MALSPRLLNLSVYINEHLHEDLSLITLAERMKLSPFHFHRKFHSYFGESLHQHIKRLRLERSSYELVHQVKPIKAIALASGYKTISAFSHAFANYANISPTRYRSQMLNGALTAARASMRAKFSADFLEQLNPQQVVYLKERQISFVRVAAQGRGVQSNVRTTLQSMREMIPVAEEFYAISVDFYGIEKAGNYRIDVGVDAALLPLRRRSQFGLQTLPSGRYAVFELQCSSADLLDITYAAYLFWLPRTAERPRASAHFVSFRPAVDQSAHGEKRAYKFYVPLEG
jgi:AraC family transcriptional regulator